jgi:AbrB family looped-hinge helix DNA binding protein
MQSRHVKIAPGGRVVLPAEFRKTLGVSVGDSVVIELEDGELRLRSLDAAIKRARRRSENTSRRESRWLTS